MRRPGGNNVTVDQAHIASQNGSVLIDVRTARERDTDGRPAGARHIPMEKLAGRIDALRSQQVLVICRSGRRSAHAASMLRRQGVAAKNVKGGMLSWRRRGLPMETKRKGRKR